MKTRNKQFDLNHQYQLYLQRVNITEAQMHPTQRIETKRAFFGALGQLLVLMRDDIGVLEEDEGVRVLDDMVAQVKVFWNSQTNRGAGPQS